MANGRSFSLPTSGPILEANEAPSAAPAPVLPPEASPRRAPKPSAAARVEVKRELPSKREDRPRFNRGS
ncbi:uncharacterized protein STAUR_6957 [Stigmatella aurantiaca DW4/3-1]|uniref:Uncharacterized protein n=1 Tax=Stigmatella aurantiaca (strain DW4/3-1) TaxID=378806 RepID=E3FUL5_STIAD|nr:uncharacterized protein STAUR_6957 [Stigmatella aurantiaca DW4/3-1]